MANKKLTDKQLAFANEYIIDFNATKAAIRAGYAESRAQQTGSDLLANPKVQDAIATAIEERNKRAKVDADYVLNRLVEIDQMDVIDILDAQGNILPLAKWPKQWRTTINSFDIQEIIGLDEAALIKKIKWPDKVRNLELLGKHVDVQAWKEKVEHDGNLQITNLIKDISKEAAESENDSPLPKDNI